MESFERRLKRQPLRQVPAEWRRDILAAASKAQSARHTQLGSHTFLSRLNKRLMSLLWPHPVAWGGLAAVWIFTAAANVSMQDRAPVVAQKAPAPSAEVIAEVQQQHRLFAELLGENELSPADRPKKIIPGPRSGSLEIMSA